MLTLALTAPPGHGYSGDRMLFWTWELCMFLGLVLAVGQGLILRRYWRRTTWLRWIAACWLGAGLGIALAFVGAAPNCGPLLGVWPGFIFGLAQVVVLRPYLPEAALWPLANGGGWLAAVLAHILITRLFAEVAQRAVPALPTDGTFYWAIGWMVGALVYGAITGLALVWMLRQPRAVPSRPTTSLEPSDLHY